MFTPIFTCNIELFPRKYKKLKRSNYNGSLWNHSYFCLVSSSVRLFSVLIAKASINKKRSAHPLRLFQQCWGSESRSEYFHPKSRIQGRKDPESRIQGQKIPNPGAKVEKIPDPKLHQRFQVFLTQHLLPKLSEIQYGIFIPDPDFFHPGSSGNKSTGSQILEPDPQYCSFRWAFWATVLRGGIFIWNTIPSNQYFSMFFFWWLEKLLF